MAVRKTDQQRRGEAESRKDEAEKWKIRTEERDKEEPKS